MKVGILGAGAMGSVHARHFTAMPDVDLHFYDPDLPSATAFRSTYGAEQANSAEELIRSVEVVDVCLPNDLHEEFALQAIQAGKPTFIEKPIAIDSAAAQRIADAGTKASVSIGVGQVVRYFPEFREARRSVVEGKIGKPAAVRTRRGGAMPTRGWFADHSRSGGVLLDLAVHDFDWLRWMLGEVKEVFSQSVGADTMAGPDYALTTLAFESGAVAHVEATWMDPGGSRTSFEICGSGGMIEYDSRLATTLRTSTSSKSVTEAPLGRTDDPFYCELREFVEAVAEGKEPPVTIDEGIAALRIAEAALESAKTRKPVQLCK